MKYFHQLSRSLPRWLFLKSTKHSHKVYSTHLKRPNKLRTLDMIPENDLSEYKTDFISAQEWQVSIYKNYKSKSEEDYSSSYGRGLYMENEDGELSWFNAGVRVGVGIGLGVCLGVGIGVDLMVGTYQATTRKFRGRLF